MLAGGSRGRARGEFEVARPRRNDGTRTTMGGGWMVGWLGGGWAERAGCGEKRVAEG